MRDVPAAMAAKIETGATTFCRCWTLTRQDGAVLGFTDHDRDLVIAGVTFEAASGLDRTAMDASEGLAAGGGEVSGALRSARILPEEIELGFYDGAAIRSWLVDWSAPALNFLVESARLGEIRRQDGNFIAETRGPLAALEAEKGRRYALACSAELGDPSCGVDFAALALRAAGALSSVPDAATLILPEAASFASGFFSRGRLTFTSGANAGLIVPVRAHEAGGKLLLWHAQARLPAPGDEVVVTTGCDKSLATCRGRFANSLNFRGFPYLPQPETVVAYARPGEGRHQGRPLVP